MFHESISLSWVTTCDGSIEMKKILLCIKIYANEIGSSYWKVEKLNNSAIMGHIWPFSIITWDIYAPPSRTHTFSGVLNVFTQHSGRVEPKWLLH